MNIIVRFLHKPEPERGLLEQDGWKYRWGCYRHPEVRDEQAARNRLLNLGLLTSPRVQIEFVAKKFRYPFPS